jgi:hypothetical protein
MSLPNSARDTGTSILGVRIAVDDTIPNCPRCFVMSGKHAKTRETAWYAFCRRSGALEKVGPYETFGQALKYLNLTKGCDSCKFNSSERKEDLIPLLDVKVKEEMEKIYGDSFSTVMTPLQFFVENRYYFDINFSNRFGIRFFKSLPEDMLAAVDFTRKCMDRDNFVFKVQALASLFDRTNEDEIRKLIKDPRKQKIEGSLNILEQILKENSGSYPRHILSNLRNLMALRSKVYPTHGTASEIIVILNNFGIDRYPLPDWQAGWVKILTLCGHSLGNLVKELQTK